MGQVVAFLPGPDAEAAPAPFSANGYGITSHFRNIVTDLWAPSAPRSRRAISSAWHAISPPKSRAFSSLNFVVLILLFAIGYHMLPLWISNKGTPKSLTNSDGSWPPRTFFRWTWKQQTQQIKYCGTLYCTWLTNKLTTLPSNNIPCEHLPFRLVQKI